MIKDQIFDYVGDHWFKIFWLCMGIIFISVILWNSLSPDGSVHLKQVEQDKFESVKNDCKSLALFIRDNYNGYYEKAYEHYYSWSCQK